MGMAVTAIVGGASMPNVLEAIQRYRADAAPRQVMADLRLAQSHAIARGVQTRIVIFNGDGQATGAGYADASMANRYRLEARPTGGAWPGLADTMTTDANVLTEWIDLGAYRQRVVQANAVGFTSRGTLLNAAGPITIVLRTDPGGPQRTVQTNPVGRVTVQ